MMRFKQKNSSEVRWEKLLFGIGFISIFLMGAFLTSNNKAFADLYTLSKTINNPVPWINDGFGRSVDGAGNYLIIGAYSDDSNVGAAYLYNTSTWTYEKISNPTPEASDDFGMAVAFVGNDKVLIGARGNNPGGIFGAGAAYLYNTSTWT